MLPKASCSTCQFETQKFETECLRQFWWPFRTKIGAPSRNNEFPSNFSLKRIRVDEYDPVNDIIVRQTQLSMDDLSPEEFPLYYHALKFPKPGVLAGRVTSENVEYRIWAKIDESEFKRANHSESEGFRLGPGKPESFCRMLAKIAHA